MVMGFEACMLLPITNVINMDRSEMSLEKRKKYMRLNKSSYFDWLNSRGSNMLR